MSDVFNPVAIGFARAAPVAEELLVDASVGDLAAVSREHFPTHRIAMTREVFALLQSSTDADDPPGLWGHVLLTAHINQVRLFPGGHTFRAALGDSLRQPGWRQFQIRFHAGKHGEPCAVVMLPDHDRIQ